MKKIIIITVLVFETMLNQAQGLNADSLKSLFLSAQTDTTQILLLSRLCNELARFNPDSAIRLAQHGLKLAKQIHYFKGEVYLTLSLGVAWYNLGEYSTAIKLYLSKIKYIDTTKDMAIKGKYNAELTIAYRDQGDYAEALKYANKNLDDLYKFLQYSPRDSCKFCTGGFLLTASIYLEKHQIDSAQKYIYEALSYPMTNMKGIEASLYAAAGRLQTELKNYDTALQLYRHSVQSFLQLKQPYKGLAGVYSNMAVLFDTLGLRDSAFVYLYKSLAISKPKGFLKEKLETYQLLSKAHESHNNDSALYYYKQAMLTKEVLFNQKAQRQIASYKFDLEFQQQEVENTEAQFRSKIKIYTLLGATTFFLAMGLILFRNNDRRKKVIALLQKQKAETDHQKAKAEQAFEQLRSTQAELIEAEKEKMRAYHYKELLGLEAQALRAQMNPHFIYNCMNSIKALIQNDDKFRSIEYLATFSKLIRTLFNNSDKRQITLHDEIETCKLYTQLEAMRLNGKLKYDFRIDPNLDLKSVMVPALIVQPFIENAIWHGIVPKDGGAVGISIKGNGEAIICEVDDDGIGREMSMLNKPATPIIHESKGVHLSQQRLNLEKILNDTNASIEIIDKYDNKIATGTKVILTFNLN